MLNLARYFFNKMLTGKLIVGGVAFPLPALFAHCNRHYLLNSKIGAITHIGVTNGARVRRFGLFKPVDAWHGYSGLLRHFVSRNDGRERSERAIVAVPVSFTKLLRNKKSVNIVANTSNCSCLLSSFIPPLSKISK